MRKTLMLAVLLALGVAWPAAGDGPHGSAPPALTGSWQVSVIFYNEGTPTGGVQKLQYLQQFDADGRAAIFLPQNPADGYVEARTACVGEWAHRTGHTYDVTLYCIWQSTWLEAPAIPERIRMKVKLDKHANRWTAGPFYYEWFDGSAYVPIIDPNSYGDMVGVRLGIVPIP
jgi:hypothetical protein